MTLQSAKNILAADFNARSGTDAADRKLALGVVMNRPECRKWHWQLELYAATLSH